MNSTIDKILDPRAEDVTAVVKELAAAQWPIFDADRHSFFANMGFADGLPMEPEHESVKSGRLIVPALGTPMATWVSLNNELFSMNLFLYEASPVGSNSAIAGYRAVHRELVSLFGTPDEEDVHEHGEAASIWITEGTTIEMYSHIREPSSVQLGLSHTDRNKAYEALFAT